MGDAAGGPPAIADNLMSVAGQRVSRFRFRPPGGRGDPGRLHRKRCGPASVRRSPTRRSSNGWQPGATVSTWAGNAGRAARQQRLIEALAKLSGEKLPADPKLLQALDRLADHGFEEFEGAPRKTRPLIKSLDRLLETVRSRAGVRLCDELSAKDAALLVDSLQKIGDEQWNARAKKMRDSIPRA